MLGESPGISAGLTAHSGDSEMVAEVTPRPVWGDTDWLDWSDSFGTAPNRTFDIRLRKFAAATAPGL